MAMDDARFDRLARRLGAAGTRRGALAGLLGGILGGTALGGGAETRRGRSDGEDGADAVGRHRRRRRKECVPACGANFECFKGVCHCPAVRCGDACCPVGQVCQNGACADVVSCHAYGESCGDSIPCCDGLECGSGYGGGPVGCWLTPGSACTANGQCGYGQLCRNGVCTVDCAGGCVAPLVCRDGACVYAAPSQVAAFGTFGDVASTNGGLGQTDGFLNYPTSIALDASGTTAWIADRFNSRVVVWTKSWGVWTHVASMGNGGDGTEGGGTGEMRGPFGVAVNPQGTVAWITDSGTYVPNPTPPVPNNRVVIWTKRGGAWSQTGEFGSYGVATGNSQTDGYLRDPFGLWVDPAGTTVFIADRVNNRIVIWKNLGGAWTHTASFGTFGDADLGQTDGKLNKPRDVVVDGAGTTAYVTDNLNNRVVVWTLSGGTWRHTATFGRAGDETGPTDGVVHFPFEMAMNSDSSVMWVANRGGSRITVWTAGDGSWSQVSSFGRYGNTNLGQTDGQMDEPRGVGYVDGGTTVWVVDTDNSRITVWE